MIGGMKVSRLLHAGYLIETPRAAVVFDPLFETPFSQNCYAFPGVRFDFEKLQQVKLDAVIISHYHDDHCSLDSLDRLCRSIPIFVFAQDLEILTMIRQLGFTDVRSLNLREPIHIGDCLIKAYKALDEEIDCVIEVQAQDRKILNVVDAWMGWDTVKELAAQGPWDLVLWPMQVMRELEVLSPRRLRHRNIELPAEWLEQIQMLRPRIVVPSSCQFRFEEWSWYNKFYFPISYKQFTEAVQEVLGVGQVLRLDPSIGLELGCQDWKLTQGPDWISLVNEDDRALDYEFDLSRAVPSLGEMAQNFAPLSLADLQLVRNFCELDLLQKYQALIHLEDSYFAQSRIWRLAVYVSSQEMLVFDFEIHNHQIRQKSPRTLSVGEKLEDGIDWLTEILAAKLASCLLVGDSLSSLYLRINDRIFSPAKEQVFLEVDLLEDPLIRCLFEGDPYRYQRRQLESLTGGHRHMNWTS